MQLGRKEEADEPSVPPFTEGILEQPKRGTHSWFLLQVGSRRDAVIVSLTGTILVIKFFAWWSCYGCGDVRGRGRILHF